MDSFFKNFQNTQQGFMQNPMSLAGLLVAQGKPYSEAITEAVNISNQYQQQEYAKQRAEQEKQQALQMQQMQGRLGNLLQGRADINAPEVAIELLNAGVAPQNVANIASLFGKPITANQTFSGPGGFKYEQFQNPETGQLEARKLAGQELPREMPKVSPAQQRLNGVKLKELAGDARSAQTELRILEDLDKAFKKLDESSGEFTKPGTIASKLATNFESLPNVLYNEEAQSALQQIEKGNSLLFQNRVRAAGGRATDTFKEEVKKGLPTAKLNPEARRELLIAKKRENLEALARSKFFNEWARQNNKDIDGAEDAFVAYISDVPLLKENNEINKDILNLIPQVVSNYLSQEGQAIDELGHSIEQIPTDEAIIEEDEFENIPLETLIELRARKARGK